MTGPDRAGELSAALLSLAARAGQAGEEAGRLREAAQEKSETAAAHGWCGLSIQLTQVGEHLDGVMVQVESAQQSCESAQQVVSAIRSAVSTSEVEEQLTTALREVDTAQTCAEEARELADSARIACDAAGLRPQSALISLSAEIETLQALISVCRDGLADEQQAAADHGRQIEPSAPATSNLEYLVQTGDNSFTAPSRRPDPRWVPEGDPESIDQRAPKLKKESIGYQNETARTMAAAGYRIR